ncbi:MAG: phosphoribosylformylglycinamidine synthase subunit PurQ [Candidatus Ancillula sp.]|jgi:phosphoribosylformylglycinamidine synthase|nr:phosphoribosylformylglycinamidine synthase subunit PurQ [Candidatus Ancillula sp.]
MNNIFEETVRKDNEEFEKLMSGSLDDLLNNDDLNKNEQNDDIKIGVITFPGTLDDKDAMRAVRLAGASAVSLWHQDQDLKNVDAIVVPGGFSYGDYLRCGAISRFAPIMEKVVDAANGGMPVLGICNGFQILTESHLLPGALARNNHQKFICKEQSLRVENNNTAWTNRFGNKEEIVIPLKNGEGRFTADQKTIDELEGEGRVVFRYIDGNPNGSQNDIAGVTNKKGNVVGLMPHPEHAVEKGFGTLALGEEKGLRNRIDGLRFFQSTIDYLVNKVGE